MPGAARKRESLSGRSKVTWGMGVSIAEIRAAACCPKAFSAKLPHCAKIGCMLPRWISSFVRIGLLCAVISPAGKTQTPPGTCTAGVQPRTVRSEGQAELVADYVVTCTGGTPAKSGATLPTMDFTASLVKSSVTSRLLLSPWVESLLLIDEPVPGVQLLCTNSNGICPISATGTGAGNYSGAPARPNIFQGKIGASADQILWTGIPFDFPGPNGKRVLRFTNIRAAALNGPPAIQMSLAAAGGGVALAIVNSTQVVANSQAGVRAGVKNVQGGPNGLTQFTISFTETFNNAFKTRTAASFVNANTSPPPADENTPGNSNPGSETGFYSSAFPAIVGRGSTGVAGLADNGTRLVAMLQNLPAGVNVSVPLTVTVAGALGATGVARLITTDNAGAGSFSPASSTQVALLKGSAAIVYEIVQTSPQGVESADIPISLSYAAPASLFSTQVAAGLAPLSGSATADLVSPLPRFNNAVVLSVTSPLLVVTTTLPNAPAGSSYSYQLAAAGGTTPYRWTSSGLPAGLSLTPAGAIGGVANAPGSYLIVIGVTDASGLSASAALTLTVGAGIQFTGTTLPNATAGSPYSSTIQAGGGAAPYTFVAPSSPIVPYPLPDGLTLSTAGTLSGTPTTAGNYTFAVTVTDNNKSQATATFSLTVLPPLAIVTASPLPAAAVGVPYTQTIAASGGASPYTFAFSGPPLQGFTLSAQGALSGTPPAAGTFTFTAQVTDSLKSVAAKQFQLPVSVSAPALQAPVSLLEFQAVVDSDSPPPQGVPVIATGAASVKFTIQADGGSANTPAPSWLKVRLLDGITPGFIVVNATQAGLKAGVYSARIHLVPASASTGGPPQSSIGIDVKLTVADAPPSLDAFPNVLRYQARVAAPGSQDQVLAVRNAGGGGALKFTVSVLRGLWIDSITPASGETAPDAPVFITVKVNTRGLPAGGVRDVIRVTSAAGTVDVPVALFVAPAGPALALNVTGLRYGGQASNTAAAPQTVSVLNIGDPGTTVNWKAELLTGSGWLSIATPTGLATPGNPGALTIAPSANAGNFPAGPRYALVRVSDPAALNSPQYIVSVLDLRAGDALPVPEPVPGGLLFTAAPPAAPPPQTISIWTTSNSPVPFQAAASTNEGGAWLSVSPASGTATGANPGRTSVTVNTAGLAPGFYRGSVNFAIGGTVRSTNVSLVVAASGSAAAFSKSRAAGCAAARMSVAQVGTANNFSVPAGWPATLSVKLTDDCGASVDGASVIARFSNGDPPITLGSSGSGTYSRSWQPGNRASRVTVTVDAIAAGLASANSQLTGEINANSQPPPSLARNGTLHNLNPVVGAPLAPNTVAQVFGTGLASSPVSTGLVPLATEFNGTSMLVGAFQAPLYFLSPNQLTVQIPAELAPNNQYPVLVIANDIPTLVPDTVTLNAAAPGIAQFPDGTIIAQHAADFSLVSAASPARPGEVLIMYLAGMGATNPAVASSKTAPAAEPLARVVTPATVTVDGQDAAIGYAGLTPAGIGLYQINFVVPANARPGVLDVVVRQGFAAGNTTKLPVQ